MLHPLPILFAFLAAWLTPARAVPEFIMNQPLRVTLSIEQREIIRGESAYFTVVVENVSGGPLENVLTLDPYAETLRIQATSPESTFTATERGILQREGGYSHGPRHPPTTTLQPKGTMTLRDDLLRWFEDLPPGQYAITALYMGKRVPITSEKVPLRVHPADPVALDTPRPGDRLGSAALGAAWVHRAPVSAGGGHLVFYQHQSQNLPRSPVHCVRIAAVTDPVQPLAATLATPTTQAGWVVWADARQRLMGATTRVLQPALGEPGLIRTPYAGAPLPSPLALRNGGLLVPFVDATRTKACVVTLPPDGPAGAIDLPLGSGVPLGPSAWIWSREYHLDAVWAKAGGREIMSSRVPLDDLAAGFSTPQAIGLDDPVIWIDGYNDAESARARQVGDGEPPRPDTIVWCVLKRDKSLALARVNLAIRQVSTPWSFPLPDNAPLEPIASSVTKDGDLALLLKSPKGLMYACTAGNRLLPLREAAGVDITPAQMPGLMSGGRDASRSWVYVRFIDRTQNRIRSVKLEPVGEPDPSEPRTKPAPRQEQPGDWPEPDPDGPGGL